LESIAFWIFSGLKRQGKLIRNYIKPRPNNLITISEEARTMRKVKESSSSEPSRKTRPAIFPEARENQLVSLAVDLAEKQLSEGTASSQVITHYLKLGSTRERIEKEILEKQKELIEAKTQSLQSAQRIEELYLNALNAMRNYTGQDDSNEY
jgi:hypothetical protein